jgi:ABC-type branched-subunit amino acid transport system substrate-binding protein
VSYSGPGRDAGHDLTDTEIRIGLLAPLTGARQAEGKALRQAAELAIEELNATSLPGARRLVLVARDESGQWGAASSEIVRFVFDDHAVALVTSTDGGAAHLAEQVANKVGIPVLTLSSDATTTQINLPWIFRLGPTDAAQAQVFAQDIYGRRKLQRVALICENDHDGRVGGEQFMIATRALNAPAPVAITVEPQSASRSATRPTGSSAQPEPQTAAADSRARLANVLESAQAVVIWSDAITADFFIGPLDGISLPLPVYICRKAAQSDAVSAGQLRCKLGGVEGCWTVGTEGASAIHQAFVQNYRWHYGENPGIAAAQAYDAVCLIAASLRLSGPNRARLRDALANAHNFPGASGVISFDHAGNDDSGVALFALP